MEYIDVRTIDVNGKTYTLIIEPDPYSNPNEADCYTPEDIDAFNWGGWRYVTVVVQATHGEATLGGVAYGTIAGRDITTDALINDPYMSVKNPDGTERTYTMVESLADEITEVPA